ncbi:MAG: MBL fold metallo-hydrolase [Chloroflexota bacterium]|nr:MBL fold metallo-hydrolase [Chloroflexota bacterium]
MEIRVLGAHNAESATARLTSFLVDGVLAIDAGALTRSLSLAEQEKVNSILLTHCHYDHIRDVATLGLNNSFSKRTIGVYGQNVTLDVLATNILNGVVYPNLTELPDPDSPAIRFHALEPYEVNDIDGYKVMAVPVKHPVSTVGYQITSADGTSFFYSGDTGANLSACWEVISPQLMFIDLTLPNRLEDLAAVSGHLTPLMLADELARFKELKGYIPMVVPVHLNALFEVEIKREVEEVAEKLSATINVSHAGMTLTI